MVAAGAVHPERAENQWEPRYSWIRIGITRDGTKRLLNVEVYPRLWLKNGAKFVADSNSCNGRESEVYHLELEPWSAPLATSADEVVAEEAVGPTETTGEEIVNRGRLLTYRFFELPHVSRLDIARNLDLLKDEDEGLGDTELFHRVLIRARDAELLAALWDKVQEKHADGQYTDNPYATKG